VPKVPRCYGSYGDQGWKEERERETERKRGGDFCWGLIFCVFFAKVDDAKTSKDFQ
jgi:hypothetical protein